MAWITNWDGSLIQTDDKVADNSEYYGLQNPVGTQFSNQDLTPMMNQLWLPPVVPLVQDMGQYVYLGDQLANDLGADSQIVKIDSPQAQAEIDKANVINTTMQLNDLVNQGQFEVANRQDTLRGMADVVDKLNVLLTGQTSILDALRAQRVSTREYEVPPSQRIAYVAFSPEELKVAREIKKLSTGRMNKPGLIQGIQALAGGQVPGAYDKRLIAELINDDEAIAELAKKTDLSKSAIDGVLRAIMGAGVSAALFGVTKNFPVSAMGYFGVNTIMDNLSGKSLFDGVSLRSASIDGYPLKIDSIELPDGLPNDIFSDYQYICFDRLTGKVYPSDEIKFIASSGGSFRWLCTDRLDGKIYHAYAIKQPRIYLGG